MENILEKKHNQYLKFVYSDNNNLSIIFQSNELLSNVVGEFNSNIKELEKITNTNIYTRGNSISVKGSDKENEIIKNAIIFLSDRFLNNGSLEKKDVLSSINEFMIEEKSENKNNVEYIIKTPKKSVIPRSEKQKNYVRALKEKDIVISAGPAGTGKTFLAVAVALSMLLEKKIERIILSRPAVEAGERLGFLPGDMKEKVDPYLRPLYDSLYDLLDFEKIQKKIEIGDIEIAPLAFMRGRTLKNSFAILDEAQNATDTQIKMFLTRIGENSKIVINGDPSQIDLPNKSYSGLVRSKKILGQIKEISTIDFDHLDVVRHPLVSKIVKAYSDVKKKVRKIKRNKFLKCNNKEFSLLLTSSKKMKNLNFKFKNKNKSTDVLSFPNNDNFLNTDYLGDVAVNFEVVDKRSKDTNFHYEFDRMWVHGYLHLLGFDHKKIKDFAKMSKIEKKILDCFDYTF